ncbi:MAG: hypothetical protein NXI16_10320 [Alphaproteobacteria bacterium]|nr:hypothetical protein [Alphaproteobacteria bacterium]
MIFHHFEIGKISFDVVDGSIFDLGADVIVSSENTRFDMASPDAPSVSGQLSGICGMPLQHALYEQTDGGVMPAGTIIKTNGFGAARQIYHLGIHQPGQWLDDAEDRDTRETEYVDLISAWVSDILEQFAASTHGSIALPLVGCGVFGISPTLMGRQILRRVIEASGKPAMPPGKRIMLAIQEPASTQRVLDDIFQSVLDLQAPADLPDLRIGIEPIDHYVDTKVTGTNGRLAAWSLCNYAATLTSFMVCRLATYLGITEPKMIFPRTGPVSFGSFEEKGIALSSQIDDRSPEDVKLIANILAPNTPTRAALQRIVADRNNIAHDRAHRSLEAITEDTLTFSQPKRWRSNTQNPRCDDLLAKPWAARTEGNGYTGLFHRYEKNALYYCVPHTGLLFKQAHST